MTRIHYDDFPRLRQYLCFPAYFEEDVLDPVLQMEGQVWSEVVEGRLPVLEREITTLVEQSPDEESAGRNLQTWLSYSGLPDGTTWKEFLGVAYGIVRRTVEDPGSVREPEVDPWVKRTRTSTFVDQETAEEACTLVLRAHEDRFRAWAQDHEGLWRQHYVADVGRPVGTIRQLRTGEEAEATWVAVAMQRDRETGMPFVYDAWPEYPLDLEPREAFPDLPHLFGGYFGDVAEPRWTAQRNFQFSTGDPARSRVRGQLDEVLELPEDDFRGAVTAFGSHVEPAGRRRWVELIRWRLDAYDWRNPSLRRPPEESPLPR